MRGRPGLLAALEVRAEQPGRDELVEVEPHRRHVQAQSVGQVLGAQTGMRGDGTGGRVDARREVGEGVDDGPSNG